MVAAKKQTGLYTPFRALGYVTNGVPLTLQAKGNAFFMTTCIGHAFQIYGVEKMNLLFVGPNAPGEIHAMASFDDDTFVACGSRILKYRRARHVATLSYDRQVSASPFQVIQMLILGDVLLAVCDDNVLRMWDHRSQQFYNEISFPANFTVSHVIHPSTYLNKILVASREGKMQIWNIHSLKMIYDFPVQYSSPITFMAQSPVIDVVAIGLLDGRIFIHNVKMDQKIATYQQEGKVTGITFRTDDAHMMATSNNQGDVSLWDLENQQLFHNMKGIHDGAITSLHFLNGQPILLTAGVDNAVRQWIFNTIDGRPRLLKFRSGHYAPPSQIRFYGEDGHHLLSIGRDQSLRFFSTIRDAQNVELSQGSIEKVARNKNIKLEELKLSQPLHIACNESKQRQWDTILTCHAMSPEARTWSFRNKSIGKHALMTPDNASAQMVAISYCGNFGFVGSSLGGIAMYNMQSGLHRKTFAGHSKAVTGLSTDNLSRTLISTGLDGQVKFWNMSTGACESSIDVGVPISHMKFHYESGLIALLCDDVCLRVVDFFTKNIVREFWGHRNRITDLAFSADGRWLVSCSLDSTVRTWDLPSGDCVDVFKTETIATSVTFSPTGDFLATSHVNHLGIFLWANKAQYTTVSLRRMDDAEVFELALPSAMGSEVDTQIDTTQQDDVSEDMDLDEETLLNAADLDEQMIMLSSVPSSRWQVLLNLDVIKKRNKPKEAPKAPEKAPFFLPLVEGTEFAFDVKKTDDVKDDSHLERSFDPLAISEFTRLLRTTDEDAEAFAAVMEYLKALGPSAADMNLRLMEVESEPHDAALFFNVLRDQAETGRDLELINVYLTVFMKIHGEEVMKCIKNGHLEITESLDALKNMLEDKWQVLDNKIQSSLSLLEFIRGQ